MSTYLSHIWYLVDESGVYHMTTDKHGHHAHQELSAEDIEAISEIDGLTDGWYEIDDVIPGGRDEAWAKIMAEEWSLDTSKYHEKYDGLLPVAVAGRLGLRPFDGDELRQAFRAAQVLWEGCIPELAPVVCCWYDEAGQPRAEIPDRYGYDGRVFISDESIPADHERLFPPDRTWENDTLGIRCDVDGNYWYEEWCEERTGPHTAEEIVSLVDEGSHYDEEYEVWYDEWLYLYVREQYQELELRMGRAHE